MSCRKLRIVVTHLNRAGVTKKEKADKVKREVDDVRKYTVKRVIDRTARGKKNITKVRC